MSLTVLYRSTGGDSFPHRPPYFDKLTCLKSFLRSARGVPDARIVFMNDGPMPADRVELMQRHGRVLALPGLGNGPSFQGALTLALEQPDDAIVYFAEDDYLYRENAMARLAAAFAGLPLADYVTLYDHLDRYTRVDDAHGGLSRVLLAAGQHWRTVESTCMSFGARVRALRGDARVIRICTRRQGRPRDRIMWRTLQGLGLYAFRIPKRLLIGPIPSLATHMDTRSLAPFADWAAEASAAASLGPTG